MVGRLLLPKTKNYFEIFDFFIAKATGGDRSYFSARDVAKALNKRTDGVTGTLLFLSYEGYLESRFSGDIKNWNAKFRATDKAIREALPKE